ncbi:MAG: hypothetical protein C0467_05415 [Planctomycetaceae bacterium]|nr:hypothetical protein [Planctomycetaceae bacterium]
MPAPLAPDHPAAVRLLAGRILSHIIQTVKQSPAETRPFGHAYFRDLLPDDVFRAMLDTLPEVGQYASSAERHHKDDGGGYVRAQFPISVTSLDQLAPPGRGLWRAVGAALTAPELKRAVFTKLAPDLAYRYGIGEDRVPDLAGYARPTLYRETEGFEIPPHPDTRKKVVTMHLYLPEDQTQIGLGTALYRRRPLALPLGDWRRRFEVVKQFEFRPNSGYAFVVNNTLGKRSWHGRERLPDGAGVRNTLLNTFYDTPRDGFNSYLPEAEPVRRAA